MAHHQAADRCDYLIDADDRIVYVGEAWARFARENDSPHLLSEHVIGSDLWGHISGAEVKHLYRSMFDRMRRGAQEIHVPFRCDSPALRRYMLLMMRADGVGGIELTTKLLRTERRDAVGVLDPRHQAGGRMIEMCSFCKRVHTSPDWVEVEVAVECMGLFDGDGGYRLTHGVCPACRDEFTRRLES